MYKYLITFHYRWRDTEYLYKYYTTTKINIQLLTYHIHNTPLTPQTIFS